MIDVEKEVFTRAATAVRAIAPDVFVTGEYVRTPPNFPCVSITENNNRPLVVTQSTSSMENHAVLMYEVNVYSNLKSGRKSQCRSLVEAVDNAFAKMGFTRIMLNPVPNLDDATVYRVVARYEAVVDKKGTIYRR